MKAVMLEPLQLSLLICSYSSYMFWLHFFRPWNNLELGHAQYYIQLMLLQWKNVLAPAPRPIVTALDGKIGG